MKVGDIIFISDGNNLIQQIVISIDKDEKGNVIGFSAK
jgi:hypothetical protein